VKLLSASLNKVGEELSWSSFWASILRLSSRSNKFTQVSLFISCKQIGYFSSIKNVVDILKEPFLFDLSVSEYEGRGLSFAATTSQEVLHVVTPLLHTVVLLDLYLIDLVVTHL